ncbi:hypothetical protein SESBI_17282 [Sesbania bispinosa]|nr:hypothetical protein SESBI_17282 [Sesbania bispinosa]
MDLSLREEEPPALTPESTAVQRASSEKWEHSNKSILENNKAKDFLSSVGEKFKTFDKAQKGPYLSFLEKTKYDGVSGVREHMMKLVHYYNKLKSLKVELGDSYLIWQFIASTSGSKPVKKGFKGKSHFEKGNTGKAPMHLEPKKKHFEGNCAYCKKFGHKLVDCYLLKKKNSDKEGVHKPEKTK